MVGQRGDQPPVDSGQVLRRLKVLAPFGEFGPGIVEKPGYAGGIDALDVAEVAVMDARQCSVGAHIGNEGIGLVAQGNRVLAAEGPAELQAARQFEEGSVPDGS